MRLRLIPALAAVVTLLAASSEADAPPQRRVLVIHAARREAPMPVLIDQALQRTLGAAMPGRLDYYSEYIDYQRFSEPAFQQALREFLTRKYAGSRIDLLIATSDAALNLIEGSTGEPFAGVPLIFHSTQALPAATTHLATRPRPLRSTGIRTDVDLRQSVELALQLQPQTRQVFVVTGSSAWDKYYDALAREQLHGLEGRLEIHYLTDVTMSDLLARVSRLPPDSILYPLLFAEDAAGDRFNVLASFERIVAAANVPAYTWTTPTAGLGGVGGSLIAPELIADRLAELALRVLGGEPPDQIPVSLIASRIDEVDARQLQRWRISEDRVPAGTIVRFREPGLWERYKAYVAGTVLLVGLETALIVGLVVQRSRRRRLEEALRAKHRENQDLAGRLITAQEEERARIARDLHDDVSQQLAGFSIVLSGLRQRLPPASGGAMEAIVALQGRAAALADTLRSLSHELHSGALEHAGLVAALREHCAEFGSQHHIQVTFEAADDVGALDPATALCLYRVSQETLANAARHGRGSKARVRLSRTAEGIELEVSDDGVGFDPSRRAGTGLGLRSMNERVRLAGGRFVLDSAPGRGTTVTVRVPAGEPGPHPMR